MTPAQESLLSKLAAAWEHTPTARFGQLLESIEDVGWEVCGQRVFAPRLLWMDDSLFGLALDTWNSDPARRKVVAT